MSISRDVKLNPLPRWKIGDYRLEFIVISWPSLLIIIFQLPTPSQSPGDKGFHYRLIVWFLFSLFLFHTWSGACSSRKMRQRAGRKVRGGQLSKHRSTLSDMSKSMHSCSKAINCISRSSPLPICSHSNNVSGSTSDIIVTEHRSSQRDRPTGRRETAPD